MKRIVYLISLLTMVSSSAFSQVPEILGDWEDGQFASLEFRVGPNSQFATITAALAFAAPFIGVVPVTIEVETLPGGAAYNAALGEVFPIVLPAYGVTIEAFDTAGGLPLVLNLPPGGLPQPPETFLFSVMGNTQMPPSVLRGLAIVSGPVFPGRTGANVRIAVPEDPAIDARLTVQPEIRDCVITGDLDTGIDIVALPRTVVAPVIERNHIFSTDLFFGVVGIDIDGLPFPIKEQELVPLTSPYIRSNRISRFATNVSVVDGGISCRPRMWSNFIDLANTNVTLTDCAPILINNTITNAALSGGLAGGIGLTWAGLVDLTLTNNLLSNPLPGGADVAFVGAYPGVNPPFFNFDEDGTLEPLFPFPALNFSPNTNPGEPAFVDPLPGGDFHLLPTSTLINLGTQAPAAGNDVTALPSVVNVGVAPFDITIRTDCGYDIDFGSRTIGGIVDIGADEVVLDGISLVGVVGVPIGDDLDSIGNLQPDLAAGNWSTSVVVNGTPGDLYLLAAGTGYLDTIPVPGLPGVAVDNRSVYEHSFFFNPPTPFAGDFGIDFLTPNCMFILGLAQVGTPLPVTVPGFGAAFCESELFLQAVVIDPFGNTRFTNRLQLDLNCP